MEDTHIKINTAFFALFLGSYISWEYYQKYLGWIVFWCIFVVQLPELSQGRYEKMLVAFFYFKSTYLQRKDNSKYLRINGHSNYWHTKKFLHLKDTKKKILNLIPIKLHKKMEKKNLLNLKIHFRSISFSKFLMPYIYLQALFLAIYHKFDVF